MGDMIDRVAEALAQSFRQTVARVSGESWEETGVTLPSKEVFERYARAAIEAMREPTDEMGIAFWQRYHVWVENDEDASDFDLYKVMIDAALESNSTPPSGE